MIQPPNTFGPLFERVTPRHVNARTGETIFHQGDLAQALYRVELGCVRLQMLEDTGQRRVLTFFFPQDVFCAGLRTSWGSAHAISDSVLSIYPFHELWEAVASEPTSAMSLLQVFDGLLVQVADQVVIQKASAEARLRRFLGWLQARAGADLAAAPFALPLSRRDIADHLGIAPETVSRALGALQREAAMARGHADAARGGSSPTAIYDF